MRLKSVKPEVFDCSHIYESAVLLNELYRQPLAKWLYCKGDAQVPGVMLLAMVKLQCFTKKTFFNETAINPHLMSSLADE